MTNYRKYIMLCKKKKNAKLMDMCDNVIFHYFPKF